MRLVLVLIAGGVWATAIGVWVLIARVKYKDH